VTPVAWTLLGLVVALLGTIFGYIVKLTGDVSRVCACIDDAELKEMRKQVDALVLRRKWEDERAAGVIHSPHHSGPGGRDELVEKLTTDVDALSDGELYEALCLLEAEVKASRGLRQEYAWRLVDRAKAEIAERSRHG
jgi:hypothetical protein